MDQYLKGFLDELETKTLERWNQCTPQHFRPGREYTEWDRPPTNWKQKPSIPDSIAFELHLISLEIDVDSASEKTMYEIFDIIPESFPPAHLLTDDQIDELILGIYRLWTAYNYHPQPPYQFPNRRFYPIILQYMHEPTVIHNYTNCMVNFCGYYPPDCPFGDYCHCRCDDDDDDYENFLEEEMIENNI